MQFIHSCWGRLWSSGLRLSLHRCTPSRLGCLAAVAGVGPAGGYDDEVVTCESHDMGWVHCDIDVANGVDLVRQLSSNSCIRGSEWGTDRSGVWVTLAAAPSSVRARRVRHLRQRKASAWCAAWCAANPMAVRRAARCAWMAPRAPARQLSVLPCREGQAGATSAMRSDQPLPGRFRGGRGWPLRRCAASPDLRIEVEEAAFLRRQHLRWRGRFRAAVEHALRGRQYLGLEPQRHLGGRRLPRRISGELSPGGSNAAGRGLQWAHEHCLRHRLRPL